MLKMIVYNAAYRTTPPIRLAHPSIMVSKVFWINLPPQLTSKTTTKKTKAKAMNGNHFDEILVLFSIQPATIVDNFKAAANPIIKAIMENNAMIRPLL